MSIDSLQNRYGNFYTPRFRVVVGDREFRDAGGLISGLSVDTVVDGADTFSFTLNGAFDRELGEFNGVDRERFDTGVPVSISMGYGDQLERVSVGRIHSVRPDFPADGGPTIEVSGYGLLYDTTTGTRSRSWDETTDSDVAEDVASGYDFAELNVEPTRTKRRKVIQNEESDYRFLKTLADRNGYELFAEGDTLHLRAPPFGSDPEITLAYGESLRSFSPELTSSDRVNRVRVRHWDPKAKREIVGAAERDGGGRGEVVLRVPVESREEADDVAEAALERIAEGLIRGRGETLGIPSIRAGETIGLTGLGSEFDMTYYVSSATHRIGRSDYTTTFEVKERTV